MYGCGASGSTEAILILTRHTEFHSEILDSHLIHQDNLILPFHKKLRLSKKQNLAPRNKTA